MATSRAASQPRQQHKFVGEGPPARAHRARPPALRIMRAGGGEKARFAGLLSPWLALTCPRSSPSRCSPGTMERSRSKARLARISGGGGSKGKPATTWRSALTAPTMLVKQARVVGSEPPRPWRDRCRAPAPTFDPLSPDFGALASTAHGSSNSSPTDAFLKRGASANART